MRAHGRDRSGPGGPQLRPSAYGVPSPVLVARADRGFARFLERTGDRDDGAGGGRDAPR